MNRKRKRLLTTAILLLVLTASATGCMSTGTPTASLPACPHMLGSWTSLEYDVLQVFSDHSQDVVSGYVSIFDVTRQRGCEFSGRHTWESDEDRVQSYFIGMVDPGNHEFTIIEPGTASRYVGNVDGDQMSLVFTHTAPDLSHLLAYSTSLAREDEDPVATICPQITGTWNSGAYNVMDVYADGTTEISGGWTTQLQILTQEGCMFRAIDTWTGGDETGSAPIAGVIHPDGVTLSMIEVPESGQLGPIAHITAHLSAPERLDLNFIGEFSDNSENLAFTASYSQSTPPPAPRVCQDVTGSWSGGPFEAYRISQNGTASTVQRTARELVIAEQNGCLISGQNRWAGEDGMMNSEYFVGHVDPDSYTLTIMELDPHPVDGTTALITGRLLSDSSMLSEYTGYAGDGSFAQVFAEVLTREQAAPAKNIP